MNAVPSSTPAPEAPAEFIARLTAAGWTPARIVVAAGHPGYGARHAAAAVARIVDCAAAGRTLSFHEALR